MEGSPLAADLGRRARGTLTCKRQRAARKRPRAGGIRDQPSLPRGEEARAAKETSSLFCEETSPAEESPLAATRATFSALKHCARLVGRGPCKRGCAAGVTFRRNYRAVCADVIVATMLVRRRARPVLLS